MTTPEATDTTAPVPQRPSKKLLAGMIVSHIISILLVIALALLGLLLNALGGGGLGYMYIIFFGPLALFIPVILSWVFYAKRNARGALIATLVPWLFFCLDAIAIAMLWSYMALISSGP